MTAQFLRGQLFQTPQLPQGCSFEGKTAIVTGANRGIGFYACEYLVDLGVSHLILACRDVDKGEDARQKLSSRLQAARSSSNGTREDSTIDKQKTLIEVWELDLSTYKSVLAFSRRCETLQRLDAVVENAGILTNRYVSMEGEESSIKINVLSTMLLGLLLIPILRNSAVKYNITPHLCIIGSVVHFWAPLQEFQTAGNVFDALSDPDKADMKNRYYASKLPVILLTRELAQRVSRSTSDKAPLIVVNCVAPGYTKTDMMRSPENLPGAQIHLMLVGRKPESSAKTLVHGMMAGKKSHGQYLSECRIKPASAFVRSEDGALLQTKLWNEMIERFNKVKPGIEETV